MELVQYYLSNHWKVLFVPNPILVFFCSQFFIDAIPADTVLCATEIDIKNYIHLTSPGYTEYTT